jgi:hypothetical protein
MKQETLEEVAKSHAIYELENNYKPTKESFKLACKRSFIQGAKWQQERMYSEDEVRGMLEDMSRYVSTKEMRDDVDGVGYSEWVRKRDWFVNHLIEQFKKK